MGSCLKKLRVVLLSFFILAVTAPAAQAYVLSGPHLIELMTTKLGRVKRLMAVQKLFIYDSGLQHTPVELNETVRYLFPISFRSDIESDGAKRFYVASRDAAVTIVDGQIASQDESRFDRYKDILLYHSRTALIEHLTLMGLDVTLTSLGRFEGLTAFVIGAQYPDVSSSQIWIDRETFRPFRWLIVENRSGGGRDRFEIRYLNWQRIDGKWYPMQIEFYEGLQLIRKIRVDSIRIDPDIARDIFDVEHFRSMYQTLPEHGLDSEGAGGLRELKMTIENFKKLYE